MLLRRGRASPRGANTRASPLPQPFLSLSLMKGQARKEETPGEIQAQVPQWKVSAYSNVSGFSVGLWLHFRQVVQTVLQFFVLKPPPETESDRKSLTQLFKLQFSSILPDYVSIFNYLFIKYTMHSLLEEPRPSGRVSALCAKGPGSRPRHLTTVDDGKGLCLQL